MHFPVYFNIFGHQLHAHPVMEVIGYSAGFQLYLLLRRRWSRVGRFATGGSPAPVVVPVEQHLWILVGCVFGALAGSRLLAWLESPLDYFPHWREPAMWLQGKTIVGGLIGGWGGIELVKKGLGIRHSTGDPFVFPLILGMAIGRIGCFLTGLDDHTHGNHCSLPWAVDFGDGPRHPTQLYDIVFLACLAVALAWCIRRPYPSGRIFRLFLFTYLSWRFVVEFIKPRYHPWLGLSAIQLASLLVGGLLAWMLWGGRARRKVATMA